MAMMFPVGTRDHVTIKEAPASSLFHEARSDRDIESGCQTEQFTRTVTSWHRFGYFFKLMTAQVTQMPIAGKAALGEDNQLHALGSGLLDEGRHNLKVVLLITGQMLKLNHCCA
jgi:hypothetical protein